MDTVAQIIVILFLFMCLFLFWMWFCFSGYVRRWQKTRNTPQRRVYVPGSRQRQLSVQGEPTIFVSPANLPPPPKYEAMAPPSYEEVMGVHYPAYQSGQQPIVQPLTHALAQGSTTAPDTNVTINVPSSADAPAVVTVTTEERRTSVAVRA